MCVIIIKQKGMTLPREVAKTSASINPHGLGVIWLDTFEVTYHKSNQYSVLDTHRPFIAHFRWASVGAVCKSNTHPFRCGNNKNEWLMMNGTIQGLGNAVDSDTKVLAGMLGDMPRHTWKTELAKYDSRFVTINTRNRTFQVYNKHLWTQREGIWYSKTNVLQDNLIAVYGTLKKGYSNYHRFLTSCKHVGSGTTKDSYPLVIDGLPYLIDSKGIGHNVEVDVFKVDDSTMTRLDALEGHPKWYCRRQIPIKMKNGSVLTCWVYFNIREQLGTRKMHRTYTQPAPKPVYYPKVTTNWRKPLEEKTPDLDCYVSDESWRAFLEDEDEFNVTNEIPMCINCFHDLEDDFFGNHYCKSCDEWFSSSEIITNKPR